MERHAANFVRHVLLFTKLVMKRLLRKGVRRWSTSHPLADCSGVPLSLFTVDGVRLIASSGMPLSVFDIDT